MDFEQYQIISFDCYGTLIDWKKAVLNILGSVISKYHIEVEREALFTMFLEADRSVIADEYKTYREILTDITGLIAQKLSINLYHEDRNCLSDRFDEWVPFADTVESLMKLKQRFELCVISNVDNDLFNMTASKLGIELDYLITAQDVQTYKPNHNNFEQALSSFGVDRDRQLHVAQSIHHDIIPAHQMGINNVWINRYNEKIPESEVGYPGLIVPDLESLVREMGL